MPVPIMDLIQVSKLVLVKKIGWNRTPPPPSSRDQSSPTVMHLALSRKSAIIRMMMEKCEIFGLLMYRFFFSFLTEKVGVFFVKFHGYPDPKFVDGHSLMECRS